MRSLQWERIRSREGERKRTTTREKKSRQEKAIRQGRFFWRHSNCEERGAEYHPPAQPGDRGTRRSTSCYHESKGKETQREDERCSEQSRLGSGEAKLMYLRGKKREPERVSEAEERTGFPCGDLGRGRTLDSASTPEQGSQLPGSPRLLAPYWKPFLPVCSPLLDSDHRPGKILLWSLSERARGGATLLLTRSGKRVSGSGNPVLVDNASLVKKKKFGGLVAGRGDKEESGRKKVDGRLPSLTWKEWWPKKDVHQRPDYWEPPGALRAGDRAGGVQRGSGGGQLQPGPPRAQAAAWRLVPGMERGVCTLSHFTLSLPLYGDGQCARALVTPSLGLKIMNLLWLGCRFMSQAMPLYVVL